MLTVKKSNINGAGDGLFAARKIVEGTLIPVQHSRSRNQPSSRDLDFYNLDFYICDGVDTSRTRCVVEGTLAEDAAVRKRVGRAAPPRCSGVHAFLDSFSFLRSTGS